jgi:hypothetical protein
MRWRPLSLPESQSASQPVANRLMHPGDVRSLEANLVRFR